MAAGLLLPIVLVFVLRLFNILSFATTTIMVVLTLALLGFSLFGRA